MMTKKLIAPLAATVLLLSGCQQLADEGATGVPADTPVVSQPTADATDPEATASRSIEVSAAPSTPSPTQAATETASERPSSQVPTKPTQPTTKPSSAQPTTKPTTAQPSQQASGPVKDSRMGIGPLKLRHITATVSDGPATERIGDFAGYYVKVCVTALPPGYEKGLPTSAAAWSLEVEPGAKRMPAAEGVYRPALGSKTLQVGQCNEGYVSFDAKQAPEAANAYVLVYRTSFGVQGEWYFD